MADIIGHQQGAAAVTRDAQRAAVRLTLFTEKAAQYIEHRQVKCLPIGEGHQHVAIGQYNQVARVLEPTCKGMYLQARGCGRRTPRGPPNGGCNIHGRQLTTDRFGQAWVRAAAGRERLGRQVTASTQTQV